MKYLTQSRDPHENVLPHVFAYSSPISLYSIVQTNHSMLHRNKVEIDPKGGMGAHRK